MRSKEKQEEELQKKRQPGWRPSIGAGVKISEPIIEDSPRKPHQAAESAAWRLTKALQQGREEAAKAIMTEENLTESERLLLDATAAAWREDYRSSEKMLLKAAKALGGENRAWARLALAESYLNSNNRRRADEELSLAVKHIGGLGREPFLASLAALLAARVDIERGASEEAERKLAPALESEDDYLKSCALYLKACAGRWDRRIGGERRRELLLQALESFRREENLYFQSLVKLELASVEEEAEKAQETVREAARTLRLLGRVREAEKAEATADAIGRRNEEESPERKFLFVSDAMKEVYRRAFAAAMHDKKPVLILGPTGSGKTMLAEEMHRLSPRSGKPFVYVNCAALAKELILTELFGHEKGSFTGADRRKKGFFEKAEDGTIFLDEIGELSPTAQSTLFEVMSSGFFRRVGNSDPIKTEARILAATHQDLERMTAEGRFSEALRYRFTLDIEIPGLNRRREDIPQLAGRFLAEHGEGVEYELAADAVDYLLKRDYPENARGLDKLMLWAVLTTRAEGTRRITAAMLYECESKKLKISSKDEIPNYYEAMKANNDPFERGLLWDSIKRCDGDKLEACERLGLKKTAFYLRLKHYGL